MGVRRGLGDPPSPTPEALRQAVDLFRLLAVAYAVHGYASRIDQVRQPMLGWVVLAVLAAVSVAMPFVRRRDWWIISGELGVGALGILATRLVDHDDVMQAGASTVPGIWPAAAVLTAAVRSGPWAGLGATAVIAAADVIAIGTPTEGTTRNVVLLAVLATCVGYCAVVARRGEEALREGLRLQEQTRERERFARAVHDGVLQSLSLIHRRGLQLGGPAGELGALAAEQERELRRLISRGPQPAAADRVDLLDRLRRREGADVQVVGPAGEVWLPGDVAGELEAAVGAALDNVAAHAGSGAKAWVLVEAGAGEVSITVRDDGVGVTAEALQQARDAGRLGVACSIMGRMDDLGGRADYLEGFGRGTRLRLTLPMPGGGA